MSLGRPLVVSAKELHMQAVASSEAVQQLFIDAGALISLNCKVLRSCVAHCAMSMPSDRTNLGYLRVSGFQGFLFSHYKMDNQLPPPSPRDYISGYIINERSSSNLDQPVFLYRRGCYLYLGELLG